MSVLRGLTLGLLVGAAAKAQAPTPSAADLLVMPAPSGEFHLVTPPSWPPLRAPAFRPPPLAPVDTRRIQEEIQRAQRLQRFDGLLRLAVDLLGAGRPR
jgi:hypothetical protein